MHDLPFFREIERQPTDNGVAKISAAQIGRGLILRVVEVSGLGEDRFEFGYLVFIPGASFDEIMEERRGHR